MHAPVKMELSTETVINIVSLETTDVQFGSRIDL